MAEGFLSDDRVQHRNLRHRVKVRSALKNQGRSDFFRSGFGTFAHRDIKGIGREPRDQGDRIFIVGRGGHIDF